VTEVGTKALIHGLVKLTQFCAGVDPTSKFRGAISEIFGIQVSLRFHYCERHKRTAWGCRGCGRIPNAEKLAIIRAKIFNISAKCAVTFTYK